MTSTERLVEALEKSGAHPTLILRAREEFYNDFKSPLPFPINTLVRDLRRNGLEELAARAINGEFDATHEESERWARSPEGRQIIKSVMGKKRKK